MMRNKVLVLSCLPYARVEAAFTLAELLLCLLILAVIATFSIPKVLNSMQNGKYNSTAKEVAATLSSAYASLQQNGNYAGTPTLSLTPFINYVKYDTISTIDDSPNGLGTLSCSNSTPCLKMHNGGLLYFWSYNFQTANCTNNMTTSYTFDPDGIQNAATPSVEFELFNNGKLSTWGQMTASDLDYNGTCAGSAYTPGNHDPSWFKW